VCEAAGAAGPAIWCSNGFLALSMVGESSGLKLSRQTTDATMAGLFLIGSLTANHTSALQANRGVLVDKNSHEM
jgi:hypothetical protein